MITISEEAPPLLRTYAQPMWKKRFWGRFVLAERVDHSAEWLSPSVSMNATMSTASPTSVHKKRRREDCTAMQTHDVE